MNNMPENIHYRVSKTVSGTYRLRRIAYWVAVILIIVVTITIITFRIEGGYFLFTVFALPVVGIIWFIAKMIYPLLHLNMEYDYTIEDKGTFKLSYVYGKRAKLQTSCKVKDMKKIAPYFDDAKIKESISACKHVYEALPLMSKPSKYAYYALFQNEAGEDCAAIFEVTPTILKALVYYNSANTVKKEL